MHSVQQRKRVIPSSIVAEKTKVIGLECVLEDFARIAVIRRTTYVKA